MTTPPGFAPDGPLITSWPRVLVQIAWNAGGNSTSPNHWYTVSSRLRGKWKATLAGRQYEMDAVQSGTFDFSLDNLDGAFDPDNTASFFYPNVVPYRRCRLVLMANRSQNLLYPWVASGTLAISQAASAGTLAPVTGLSASPSGLTTATAWTIPSSTAAGAVYGMSGASQSWATTDCDGTTVTPGLAYACGVDVQLASGGMASLGLQVRIGWYGLTGTLLSATAGMATSVTTGWSRLTCAGTAPAGAAFALASITTTATTSAATTVRATGWQLEQAAAATAWASPGTWSQVWQGFVERWPQKYQQNGKYGVVDVTAVDALAPLSQLTLRQAMATVVAEDAPQYWFDLATPGQAADGTGSAFFDLGGSGAELDITGSAITTGVSITSTGPLGTLWNVDGPVVTLSSNQANSLGNASGGTYLAPWTGSSSIMLPSAGWTRLICFRTTLVPGAGGTFPLATLWSATAPGFQSGSGDQSGAVVSVISSGYVTAKIKNSSGVDEFFSNASVFVCDGNWHCAAVSLSADGKTVRIVVDNTYWTATAGTSLGRSPPHNDAS